MQEHWRIKFYSEYDLSFAFHMKRAEMFFQNWEQNIGKPDINTILELYNIRKYFCIDKIASLPTTASVVPFNSPPTRIT